MKGVWIIGEGGEGGGKTTCICAIAGALKERGVEVVQTREPGGSKIGSRVREILLDADGEPPGRLAETLLYFADRAEHVEKVIVPALRAGKVVLQDRGGLSTLVYQGIVKGISMDTLSLLQGIVTASVRPDVTLLFDVDAETGLARNAAAGKRDRFEQESLEFHKAVRSAYLKLAHSDPSIKVIDGTFSADEVLRQALDVVEGLLAGRSFIDPTDVQEVVYGR